jgi:hypothetical protein
VARNLGLVMRKVFGMGTARGLQAEGGLVSSAWLVWFNIHAVWCRCSDNPSLLGFGMAACATAA